MLSMASNIESTEDLNEEILEFYAKFDEKNEILNAEILDFDILEGDGAKFAVYIIEVQTSFIKYKIQKRYSLFLSLKEKIRTSFSNLNLGEINFPTKKYFGNLNPETLSTRKVLLDHFLKWLCSKHQESPIIDFLEFLEIRTRYFLNINHIQFSQLQIEDSKSSEGDILLGYLDQLNRDSSDTSKILKEIAEFFEEKKNKINFEIAKKLMIFKGCKKTKGLLSFCGKYNEETNTHLICCIGLPLLIKLMRFDLNQDAEKFLEVYSNLAPKHLHLLNLESHIEGKTQRACKESAFELIDIYLTGNPSTSINLILTNYDVQKEYSTWKMRYHNSSKKNHLYQLNHSKMDHSDRTISKSSQDTDEDRTLSNLSVETYCSSPRNKSLLSISTKLNKASSNPSEQKNGWTIFSTKSKSCTIEHQKFACVRFKIVVKATPKECLPYLTENFSWNKEVEEIQFYERSKSSFERYLKFRMRKCQNKNFLSFYTKVKIFEERENEKIIIEERPLCSRVPIQENEIEGERSAQIQLKLITGGYKEPSTEIKIMYKYLDQSSINYSANEIFDSGSSAESSLITLRDLIENQKSKC